MSFQHDAQMIIDVLDRYQQESISKAQRAIDLTPMEELVHRLKLPSIIQDGGLTEQKLDDFLEQYLTATTRVLHPASLAHQVAVPHYAGALGALIDGFTNNPMAIYEMGPGAATIEYFMINWLLEKIGWQPAPLQPGKGAEMMHGAGVFTHGGSLANLTALIAARTRIAPEVWEQGNPGDLALIAPAQSHYSIVRAAGILGIGAKSVYLLDVDERGIVLPDRLSHAYQRLLDDGRRPIALVANACSTAVGLYDPLAEIGDFCKTQQIWFHVDGAHGASALLSDKYRHYLQGIASADSVVWDGHKMMRTPGVCAALLVRNHRTLDTAFEQEASYLFHAKNQPGVDLIQRTVECTKAALALKLFIVLGALGERGLGRYVEQRMDIARDAYDYIQSQPDFHCPVQPQSNILCFRYSDWNEQHLAMRDRLIADGRFHLSTVSLAGRWCLRLVFMHPEAGLDEVRELLNAIRAQAA